MTLKSWPAPSIPGESERHASSNREASGNPRTPLHAPRGIVRALIARVSTGKFDLVRGRRRGPINGRHPIVAVIATANTATRHRHNDERNFQQIDSYLMPPWNSADFIRSRRCGEYAARLQTVSRAISSQFPAQDLPGSFFARWKVRCCRYAAAPSLAVSRLQQRAQRMPRTLFATIASPFPDPPRTIPRSHSPAATACAVGRINQRIIDRLSAGRAEIEDFMPRAKSKSLNFFFVLKPGMVGTDGDSQEASIICRISCCQEMSWRFGSKPPLYFTRPN